MRQVTAKTRHLFADIGPLRNPHDLLRDRGLIARRDRRQFFHTLGEPRLQFAASLIGVDGQAADQIGEDALADVVEDRKDFR